MPESSTNGIHTLAERAIGAFNNSNTSAILPSQFVEQSEQTQVAWIHVAIALSFILFDVGVAIVFRLGIGLSLLISALRCVGQLSIVATLLQQVFLNYNPWSVVAISFLLNLLGTFEIVVNKSPRRFHNMVMHIIDKDAITNAVDIQFPAVLIAMLGSNIPISVIGSKFAMAVEPFWAPIQFIPIVGMLCGSTITGIVVAVTYILKEFQDNRDKVEIYLSFGASRKEACRPIAIQALKLAITPAINSMSVLGIIAIPGMMTGAILGGSSVQQAARLQMIIMFMITASTTLAAVITTLVAIAVCVDQHHRVRSERITNNNSGFDWIRGGVTDVVSVTAGIWRRIRGKNQSIPESGMGGVQMSAITRVKPGKVRSIV